MKSAFFFHGLTDMIPDECDLATTRDAAKIKDKKYYVPDDFFKEGIETADYNETSSFGNNLILLALKVEDYHL